jgi:hypothetical protein
VEVGPGEAHSGIVLRLQRGGGIEVHVIAEQLRLRESTSTCTLGRQGRRSRGLHG